MTYTDHIYEEKQNVKIIFDPDIMSFLRDKNHGVIIEILRKKDMTAEEITDEYNNITGEKKSVKTIYRYLKNCEDKGLVAQVGQRVTKRVKATKVIYGRTAKIFQYYQMIKGFWENEDYKEEGKEIIDNVSKIISDKFNIQKISKKGLERLLKAIDNYLPYQLEEIIDSYVKVSKKEAHEFTVREIYTVINTLRILLPVLDKDFLKEELEECCGYKK